MTRAQRQSLERLLRSRTLAVRTTNRARALLLAAGGYSHEEIGALCEVSPVTVRVWRRAFRDTGIDSLRGTVRGRVPPAVTGAAFPAGDPLMLGGIYLGRHERAAIGWPDPEPRCRRVVTGSGAHGHRDFLQFLKAVDHHAPRDVELQLIVRRGSVLSRHAVDRWLAHPKRARFRLYRAASLGSWGEAVRAWHRPGNVVLPGPPFDAIGQWVVVPG